jgi:peptide/nickel transport system permease protein
VSVRRLLAFPVLLGVICCGVFLLVNLLPGDAATSVAGPQASSRRIAELRAALGLDRPVAVRLLDWLAGLARGDLGQSLVDGRPVGPVLFDRLVATLVVAVPSWLLALLVGCLSALVLGWLSGSLVERSGSTVLAALSAVPDLVLASGLVLLFSTVLGWLPAVSLIPVGGTALDRPEVLVLPVLTLALPTSAWIARSLRGPVSDLVARPFVVDARLRGLPLHRIASRHLVPHLLGPLAQAAALSIGGLLAGSTVIETVLAYPGLGQLLATAVTTRDVPTVQAVAVVLAAAVLLCVLAADAVGRRQ